MDISITIIFVALLALMQVPLTAVVGIRRAQTNIAFLHGDDDTLLKRMRAHGNFTETVPITLLAMAAAELSGAPVWLLWTGGATLVAGRISSFVGLTSGDGNGPLRGVGAALTTIAIIAFAGFSLYAVFG